MSRDNEKVPVEIPQNLTNEVAKELLQAQLDALNEPENVKKLKEIREDCKNEAIRIMCYMFPQAVAIQTKVLEGYGIQGAQGLVQFLTHIKEMAKTDPDIEKLYRELQSKSYVDHHF